MHHAADRGTPSSAARLHLLIAAMGTIAAAQLGCGGGGGAAPLPPTDLQVTQGWSEREVELHWTAPASPPRGYLVELSVAGGPFVPQNDPASLVPGDWDGLSVTLADDAPDGVDYAVRMRSVSGGGTSAYSEVALYHRPLNMPRNVTASFDWDALAPRIAWDRHSTAATRASVLRTEVDGYGFPLDGQGWTELAIPDPAATALLDTTAVRNHRYRYQISNVAGGATSPPSYSPTVVAGLPPPLSTSAGFDANQQAVVLTYLAGSTDTQGVRVERQPLDAQYQPTGDWELVGDFAGAPSYLYDRIWPELTAFRYRVTGYHGDVLGEPAVITYPAITGIYAPTDLAVSITDGTADLTWTNRTAHAAEIGVSYGQADQPSFAGGILAPDATHTTIEELGLGYYGFWVEARERRFDGAHATAKVNYTTPNPPDALTLASDPVPASYAQGAALLPGGGWAFLETDLYRPNLRVHAPGDPWPAIERTDARLDVAPVLLADASGWPHVFYCATQGGDPVVTHLFYDGATWRSEEMLRGVIPSPYSNLVGIQAALDAAGNPQALVVSDTGGYDWEVSYLRRVQGVWTREIVDLPPIGDLHVFGLDRAGAPHFIAGRIEYARDPQGVWHGESITPLAGNWEPHAPQLAAWDDAGNEIVLAVGLIDSRYVNDYDYEVVVAEKVDGTWSPLRRLARDARTWNAEPRFRLVTTPDRTRTTVLQTTCVGVRAYDRDENGAWHTTLVAPPLGSYDGGWSWGFMQAGFDAAGRVHFLLRPNVAEASYTDAHEP